MTSADLIFVLRKIAGFAVSPYVWLIVGMLVCLVLLWRGRTRWVAGVLCGLVAWMLFIAIVPLGWTAINQRESLYPPAMPEGPVAGIILLGGSERRHVRAHWGRAEINEAGDRVIAAASLARQFPQARVLVTGGRGGPRPGRTDLPSEASVSAEILAGLGVQTERMLIEGRARNTLENARLGLERAAPQPGEHWILITSGYHMDRALRQFRQAGWDGLIPYPVDFRTTTWGDALGWAPYRNMVTLEGGMREQLARLVFWLRGL